MPVSDVRTLLQRRLPRAVEVRHELHRIPELAYEEHDTAAVVRRELRALGLQSVDGVDDAPTATVATLGDPSKPCVALRADIDALPITENTGLPYASERAGKMHACGHDGHAANLLLTAAVLKELQDDLPVCVKLVFQPAEEGGAGAQRLVRAGVLDGRLGPRVRAIFGLHGFPEMPVGTVTTRPGPMLAATDSFRCAFRGKGCHGAFPHLGRDPILAACEAVVSLQAVVGRELDPTEPGVVTVGTFHSGTATNVIPDEAVVSGTLRTLTPEVRQQVREAVERRCRAVGDAAQCAVTFEAFDGYPATTNEAASTEYVAGVARAALGADAFLLAARPIMGGEDFAYYLEQVPGNFFFVGVRPAGAGGSYPSLHNDRFDFTDAALEVGARMFCELVLRVGTSSLLIEE